LNACEINVLQSGSKGRVHAKFGSKLMNLNVDYNYLLAKVEITLVILTEELKSPYGVPSLFIDKNDDKLYVY
jgi:hypothetical protein